MARETDFLTLYKQLGLSPDCNLAEFKQAYRRRVAALHPDRETQRPPAPHAAEQLQRLTALYGAAMDFQRRHHRLPGAVASATVRAPRPSLDRRRPTAPPTTTRSGWWALVALLLIVTGWWLWPTPSAPESGFSGRVPAPSLLGAAESPPATGPRVINLGMDIRMVQLLQGTPALINDDLWEYGPSWIRFEKNKVIDWYSSPLQPLKVDASHPPPAAPASRPT